MSSDPNNTNKHPNDTNNPSHPKKRIGRIYIDRDLCIGAASCVAVAPGVFQLDSENKAFVVDEHGADQETIMLAAQSCPTRAIFLYDEEGNQIYPPT